MAGKENHRRLKKETPGNCPGKRGKAGKATFEARKVQETQ